MIKKIFITFTILLLATIFLVYREYSGKPTLIIPYPYSFNSNSLSALKKEIVEAENANILIIGDQMGEVLSKYSPELLTNLSQKLKSPPILYNWSMPHEGLHRTLNKLKSLKKLPLIIIYHGASSELYEKTFDVFNHEEIIKNFSLYDDERVISLIITFPWLSKIFYKRMNYVELGPIKEYQNQLPGPLKILEKEVSFKLFDYELRELIDLVKNKKSHLILITTPINLEVRPHEICSHSTTNDIIELQQDIEDLIKDGNFKAAYPLALELSDETYSNALSFYLLGKTSLALGNLAQAREAFQKSSVFDCSTWRGSAVYNSILKTSAKKHQISLIDFDQYISSGLSKEGLFMDDIYPQNVFYQTMMAELEETLKKILTLY